MTDAQEASSQNGGESDGFSIEVRRLMAIQASRQVFDMEVFAMHQLVDAARVDKRMPQQMRELAKHLGSEKKARAEAGARRLTDTLTGQLERVSTADVDERTGDVAESTGPPIPLEILVAFRMNQIGSAANLDSFNELMKACYNDPATVNYALAYIQWTKREDPLNVLRRALLPNLVSRFEDFLGALLRIACLSRTETSVAGDMALRLANKCADDATRQAPPEWCGIVAATVGMDADVIKGERWPATCEVFARRNAIVHSGGKADEKYLRRLADQVDGPALGSLLVCDEAYTRIALASLEGLADVLAVGFAGHLAAGTDECADFSSAPVLRALQQGRWREAEYMANRALDGLAEDHSHHELRVNRWMARVEIGDVDLMSVRREIETWVPPPGQPRFRLAKAILLDDIFGAINALKEYYLDSAESPNIKEWPLVTKMCDRHADFQREFRLITSRQASSGSPIARQGGRRRHKGRQ